MTQAERKSISRAKSGQSAVRSRTILIWRLFVEEIDTFTSSLASTGSCMRGLLCLFVAKASFGGREQLLVKLRLLLTRHAALRMLAVDMAADLAIPT